MSEQTINNATQKYWHGLSWILFSIIIQVFVGIGSTIVFVRYLGDIGYGAVVVMADFVTLAIVMLSMGLGAAQSRILPQLFAQKKYGEAKNVIIKIISIRVALSVVVSIVLYRCIPLLLHPIYNEIPEALIKIACILIPIQMTVFCFRGVLEVTFNQKDVSLGAIKGLLVRIGCAIPVVLLDLGVVWFFFTQLLADLYLLAIYGHCFMKQVWPKVRNASQHRYEGRLYSLGFIMMLTLLSGRFLGKEMDTQILSFCLDEAGLAEVTMYSISYMLVFRALSFVGVGSGSASTLSQSMISELVESDAQRALSSLYIGQLKLFYLIAIPLIAGSFIFAEPLLILMYGQKFVGSGSVCIVLFIGIGGTVINYVNSPMLYGFGKERNLLLSRVSFGLLNVMLSYFCATKGAFGVASATGFCLFGIAVHDILVIRNLVRIRVPWGYFIKIISGSILMISVVVGYWFFFPSTLSLWKFLSGVIVAGGTFMCIMFILKPLDQEVIDNFSSLPKRILPLLAKFTK